MSMNSKDWMSIVILPLVDKLIPVFTSKKKKTIKECGCYCHTPGVVIDHFVPCCKYSNQK